MAAENQIEVFGEFNDELPEHGEYLNIGFSPSYAPFKKRWENNGVSADFIAEYFRNFYVGKQESRGETSDEMMVENLRDGVKYIANELLENAMKFQEASVPYTAQIFLSLCAQKIVFRVTNGITVEQLAGLKAFIRKVTEEDPNELYFEAMRNSALEENTGRSGLGLLSMICDHGARLGWRFSTVKPEGGGEEFMTVTTMVTLDT
jgi:hypothetical protein